MPEERQAEDVAREIERLRKKHGVKSGAGAKGAAAVSAGAGGEAPVPGSPPAPAADAEAIRELQRLRSLRAWRGRQTSIAGDVASILTRTERVQRRLGRAIDVWTEIVPPEVVRHTVLTTLRGGVLRVDADSSSVAYELDRLLREGLLVQLRERAGGTLTRVRVTVGAPPETT